MCVVACLGSSSTAGKGQAFNWIEALQNRLGQERFVLRNFGVGGDLAYNALQRLPQVIGSNPRKVVVLIGANDVLALVSAKVRRFYRLAKKTTTGSISRVVPSQPPGHRAEAQANHLVCCKSGRNDEVALRRKGRTHLRRGAILSLTQRAATVPLLLRRGESEA